MLQDVDRTLSIKNPQKSQYLAGSKGGEEYKFTVPIKIVDKLVSLTRRAALGETIPREDRVISATVRKELAFVKYIAMACTVGLIIKLLGVLGIWGDDYVDRVRSGHLRVFSNEVTVAQALKVIGGNVKWSSSSLASQHPEAKTHILVEAKWKNRPQTTVKLTGLTV